MQEKIEWDRIRAVSDKKAIGGVVNQLLGLAEDCRARGIAALSDFSLQTDDLFMKKALGMVASGYEPELLSEILYASVFSSELSNEKYLEYIIFIRCILTIQKETLPNEQMRALLEAYLGIDFFSLN